MSRPTCCQRIRSCCSCMVSLLIMGVMAVILWHFLGRPTADEVKEFVGGIDFGDFTDVLKNISDYDWGDLAFEEDPFVGDNTTNAWKTQGTGLTLELQNALDDLWQEEFKVAMDDWQESEVLTLTTTRVAVDHSCGRVPGVMLVCNGNFGDTGWVGINEVELEFKNEGGPGFIISSVAKMNEYYLHNADFKKRRYTMCHEIGHGFGLPHTDENPHNKDLGNCLDYTNTPENNMLPGDANFDRLRSIYLKGEGDALSGAAGGTTEAVEQKDSVVTSGGGNQRTLRRASRRVVVDDTGPREDDQGQYYRRVIVRHYLPEMV